MSALSLAGPLTVALLSANLPAQEPCEDGRIATITVRTQLVFDDSAGAVVSKFYDAANWVHVETRPAFIRKELLFDEGDCFDRLRLSESERLLRGYPFLQSVNVEGVRRPDGDVDVRVVTQDDWSLRLEPRVEFAGGPEVTGLSVSERNLIGTGRGIELHYVDEPGRDEIGFGYLDPRFLGTRLNLSLGGARTDPGWLLRGRVAYPFVGLVGRWAAFQDVQYGETWFRYVVGDNEDRVHLVKPLIQRAIQVGAAGRMIETPRAAGVRLGTYGLSLSYERMTYGSTFLFDSLRAADLEISEPSASERVDESLREREEVRVNLLIGVRGLEFVERQGLATLSAIEDIPIGASVDFVFGLASRAFGSRDNHVLVGVDFFGGARIAGDWFSSLSADVEARRDYEGRDWRDIFGSFQWTNFWHTSTRHTLLLTGQYSAGWDATVPFQLTLGGPSGLSGLASHRYPGGARAVVRLEDQLLLARAGRLFDLGTVAFVDAGEVWANDVPFGVDSGIKGSVGAGLRLATPAGSRLTYRLEVAAPIRSNLGFDDLVLSIRIERFFRLHSVILDGQLARSRDFGLNTLSRNLR